MAGIRTSKKADERTGTKPRTMRKSKRNMYKIKITKGEVKCISKGRQARKEDRKKHHLV